MTILFSAALWADVHPVPLDPQADPSTCAQCHQDKVSGKHVHSAIAAGCMSCHEIRVTYNTTRVKLKTATTSALCLGCHANKDASSIHGKVHSPAVRDCIKCHDPHSSENQAQLLKASAGDSRESNLCLKCHSTGTNVPKEGSRHAALDAGCESCHVTHKTGERGKREFDFHLVKDAPGLCADCHDLKDAAFLKSHQGQPISASDCLTCHDPHQSNQKHLLAKFTHAPFAGGVCDGCHQPPKDGKVVLSAASSKELCLSCHSDKGEQIAKAKVPHPGAAGDCVDCHNPHASSQPGLPKANGVSLCLNCHTAQAEMGKKAHPHVAAYETGCATCHDPHGNDNLHLLRKPNTNDLCLECHGPEVEHVKLESEHMVAIFDGKVKLPANYFRKTVILPIKYGLGHPVEHHPVKDQVDQQSGKVEKESHCLSGHQPHASANEGLLVNDQENNSQFCGSCHKEMKR